MAVKNFLQRKPQPKYGNKKLTTPDGDFDSRKEYLRWCELKILERAHKIRDLERQKKFVLIPSQRDERGKLIEKECSYIADFSYYDAEKKTAVVEDTKGYRTKDYIIKRKLMLYIHGIRILEI